MTETYPKNKARARLRSLAEALDSGALAQVSRILNEDLTPGDIAHLLESSPPKERRLLWSLMDRELEGDVLAYIDDDIRAEFLADLDAQDVIELTEDFEVDDLADLLQQLPESIYREVLSSMDEHDRQRVEEVLSYPEDSAGGLMNTDVVTVRPDITVDVVLRYLRMHKQLPPMTDSLIVVSRKDEYIGILPITRLLVSQPAATVREIMRTDIEPIPVTLLDREVANLFERYDLVSAPVVDERGRLVGRITVDDVVDVIREDADHEILSMAGLDEDDDMFAPIVQTAKNRAVWLGINLITAFVASAVVGMFQATIDKVVALAVLMPIVASMGGIAGSQALTLVIRGMATGKVGSSNLGWLINREFVVGVLNGLLWAVVVAIAAMVWFDDWTIGAIIASAMLINLTIAALSGTVLPVVLKALKIDPALAGGVILTTLTDVVGFMSFLGLATLVYS
ncbi:MAG: magnesium transporter [Gammaproteobacteria bacterium]|nr:MAG: magnesium transporter [Gammaproteobacteria bacterium]